MIRTFGPDRNEIDALLTHGEFYRLTVKEETDSTNLRLKALAAQGEAEGAVMIAGSQTAGRGRLGRSFYSPEGGGLYMSILLRPHLPAGQALTLTTKAAVAVMDAVQRRGIACGIKWVNDILADGKKVCGILTEGSADPGTGLLRWAIVGIGLNVRSPEGGFPEDISRIAGALYARDAVPGNACSEIAADILNGFYDLYTGSPTCHIERYRAASAVLGKDILVLRGEASYPARALAIEDNFCLRVRRGDGREEILSSGEVSTRLAQQPGISVF